MTYVKGMFIILAIEDAMSRQHVHFLFSLCFPYGDLYFPNNNPNNLFS